MDTQKLFVLKSLFNYVIERFSTKSMFRFCNSFWVLFYALICDFFGFIIRHIARLRAVDDFHEMNSNSGVVCPQPDDQKSFKDSGVDGLIEKEYSVFSFGFQFQTGKDMDISFAETESSISKYQFMSGKDASGFIQEPKTMSFTVEESFGGFINKEVNFCSGITRNNDLQEQDYEGSRNRGSDQFIDFKVSGFEDGQKLVSEAEFGDQNQTEDCSKSTCSEEDIKGQEKLREVISSGLVSFEEIISMRYSSSSDEDLSFKTYKLEDTDDEYIELEPPHLHHPVEYVKESQVEDLHEFQCDHNEGTETLDGLGSWEEKKSWDWESDEEDEADILMEHRDLIEQMKMELKNPRTRALPTILEESETPKIAEDLKPLHIDEKFEHCDRVEEIHKFYKSYADKMRKLDILNYQTFHAISFLHLKEPVKLISSHKSAAVSAIKSLFLPNFNPGKLRKIYADQTLKSMSELHRDFERVYVGQICLSWEILHWQYGKTKELQEYYSQDCHSYNQVAGEFQQLQVLVQRFIEDEPFQGPRVQNYVKKRHIILGLLQVPAIKDDCFKDKNGGGDEEGAISIVMLREIIEESMRVFWEFLQADKDEASLTLKGFRSTKFDHNAADSELLTNIKSSLQKKAKRLKEILRSGNCIVNKFQKHQRGRGKHDIFISQVELRLVSRVLNLSRLTTDQLVWCQSKLNRINFVNRRISVEPSFLLFPC